MLRNGLRIARGRKQFSTAVQATNSSGNAAPPPTTSQPNGEFRKRKNFVSSTPVEQIRLERKYQEHLKNNKLETLHEAVEYVEWRGTVYPQTLKKLVQLFETSSELSSLSDRQLAVLLTYFGANCDTVSKSFRAQHLESVEKILAAKKVQLGLASRNALIECKIDNATAVDVVKELEAFEEAGIELDSKSYALLCEVYAKQCNTKAITDIIQHMKSQSIPVAEDHIVQLIYSVAKSGNDAQIGRVIESFANSMNVVRLRCAAARAIIQREKDNAGKGAYEVSEILKTIPTTAKIQSIDNNKYVINILMDFIEVGQLDAFNLLSSYLVLSEDNLHLSDSVLNQPVVAKAKSLLADGNLIGAITLYSYAHPRYSNEYFAKNLKSKLVRQLANLESDRFDEFLDVLKVAEKNGLVESVDTFLLQTITFEDVPQFEKIFDHCHQSGRLREFLFENGGLKLKLAKRMAGLFIATSDESKKARYLGKVATILFAASKDRTSEDGFKWQSIIYKLGGKDVKLAIPALESMSDRSEKREYATSIVNQLVYSLGHDHIALDKLNIFLESYQNEQLHSFWVHKKLHAKIAADQIPMQTVAKILALDFPPPNSNWSGANYSGLNLAKFLANETVTDEKAERIIGFLEAETRASLTNDELMAARGVLKGQAKKAELIGTLKRSQTLMRWRMSEVEKLIEELPLVKNPLAKLTLIDVIVYKTQKDKSDNLPLIVNILEHAVEWRKLMKQHKHHSNDRTRQNLRGLEELAISKALTANDMVLTDRLWLNRGGHLTADVSLAYASRLFVNGNVERADEVCEDLRVSSQPIRPTTLEKTGRRLKGVSTQKMNEVAEYLRKQFNLSEKQARRVVQQVKLEELNVLIENDKLDEALQMAIEETKQSERAFGQVPIMIAAIKKNNRPILESVHMMVRNAHNQDMANINLAYALIHSDNAEKARVLVEKQNLEIEDFTIQYFITLASASGSATTLKNLFLVFNGRASSLQLNLLLEIATKQLWKVGDMKSLEELKKEIASSNFPLQNRLQTFFNNLNDKRAESLENEI